MAEFSKAMMNFFGTDSPPDEVINEKVTALLAEHESLKAAKEGLEGDLKQAKEENDKLRELEPLAKVGEEYLAYLRKQAEALYELIKDGQPNEEMLKVIRNADVTQAQALVAEFEEEKTRKIPGFCPECNARVAKLEYRTSKEVEAKLKELDDNRRYKLRA